MLDRMIPFQWLAQGGGEEWVNILFIVVVAVFWAIGGLVKAAGAKKNAPQKRPEDRGTPPDRQKQETWKQRLARKAQEFQRAAEEHVRKIEKQAQSHAESERRPDHDPSGRGRVTVRSGRGGESILVYEPEQENRRERPERKHATTARSREARQRVARRGDAEPHRPKRGRQLDRPETEPTLSATQPAPLGPRERPQPPQIDQSRPKQALGKGYTASSLIDYSDADALRRAILQYEILGKPLSLRDPFERMSGF